MKKILILLLATVLFLSLPIVTYADTEGNLDGGGGGMGQGSESNKWTPGRDGVRVTVIRNSDHAVVSSSIDFSNGSNGDIKIHFGKVSKTAYRSRGLSLVFGNYNSVRPQSTMPRIISSSGGNNIAAIKSYFCREGTIKDIANELGFDYKRLISGDYKILLEPIAYFTYNGVMYAMTATEAALFNQIKGGGLRSNLPSLTHQNLPLSMFLETSDLGFPAWTGSTSGKQSDQAIISSLGLGIIRFSEQEQEVIQENDVTYRCDTEVITSVTLTTEIEKNLKTPAYAAFSINGKTYSHNDIYIPEDGSQLAWVKWKTPSEPCMITITITSNCSASTNKIAAKIIDLNENPPPDPQANDRNDGFVRPNVPSAPNITSLTWGEWDCWWHAVWEWEEDWQWESGGHTVICPEDCEQNHGIWVDYGEWVDNGFYKYKWIPYSASLSATISSKPDEKSPTAIGKILKSGYGINTNVNTNVYSEAPNSHITGAQNVVTYFPEFSYQTYWRLLERIALGYSSVFQFQKNEYSTYNCPCHFSPVWYPNGDYTIYANVLDAWTPAGMLQINLIDNLTIRDSLFEDWHIRPIKQ